MAKKPVAVCYGEIESVSPLKVRVDQKLTLTSAQLVLTSAVRDSVVNVTLDYSEGQPSSGEMKQCKVYLGLQSGEKVLLLRCDGGQQFIVLDRVEVR